MGKKVVVVHSGGMDSSICLRLMLEKYDAREVLALSFRYGQRHASSELIAADKICTDWGVERKEVLISSLENLTTDALLDSSLEIEIKNNVPTTLVTGRNGLMARLAAIHAQSLGASKICMGIIEVEEANSGYRDCSRHYMNMMEKILRLDLDQEEFEILTPVVKMTKKETMQEAFRMGVLEYLFENSVSCYNGIAKQGCQKCPACSLRNQGLKEFSQENPSLALSFSVGDL